MEEEEELLPRAPPEFQFDPQALAEILRILRALPESERADTLSLVIRRFFDATEQRETVERNGTP